MATLNTKTTSGLPAWQKYISNNPRWSDLVLKIENKMNATMLDPSGKKDLFVLKEKEEITLTSNKTKTIGKLQYAAIKYNGRSGLVPINKIRKPTNTDVLKEETIALNKLDELIKDIVKSVGPFDMVIKNDPKRKVYHNIIGTRNTTEKVLGREAKSDFNIISTAGDEIFISHKKAGGAEAFQQYGGLSSKAGRKIETHREVLSFLRKTTSYIEDNKLIQPIYSYIQSDDLINMAVFGHDYGGPFGIDNVTIIGQGQAIIKALNRDDNLYELNFTNHLVHNGNAKEFKQPSYKAILGATYRSGRSFTSDNIKYTGARVGIYPEKMIINRNGATEI